MHYFFRYSHVEAECPFISFDELLNRLEDLVVDVVERVLASPLGSLVYELNPDFKVPKKPFKRMDYTDAIKYLKDNNITKEDGSFYEFGEVYLNGDAQIENHFVHLLTFTINLFVSGHS